MARLKVLLFEEMDSRGVDHLREHAEVVFASSLDEQALLSEVTDVDGIVIRANGSVTRRLIEAAPKLKVIGRHGVGLETIDIGAATEHGVYVVNTPTANVESVAEHAVGMMIVLAKRMREGDLALREGRWSVRYDYIGFELKGRTLGVVGIGRIGFRVAEICRSLGMRLVYYDAVENHLAEESLRARRVELAELLRGSDVVSLHVPLTPATRHLIGAEELALMKPEALLINTSRGGVVDTAALLAALDSGRPGAAGLDVFEDEPLPADHPILRRNDVVVTPHMAAHTTDALYRMAMVAEDVVAVLEGRRPKHPVNEVN